MSIITETLPDYLIVQGHEIKINTDFKVWLKFSKLVDTKESFVKNIPKILELIFCELPPNIFEALEAVKHFYRHDVNTEQEKTKSNKDNFTKKVFDFEYDAAFIYSAFMQQYGIDLAESSMHWWKFKALFEGLSEDTHFVKIVHYRSADLSKIKNKEEKRFYMQMKNAFKLPDNRSDEEKEAYFNSVMESVF